MLFILPTLLSAVSTITAAVTTIGTAVSSFAATVGPILVNIVKTIPSVVDSISKFANIFLQILSILHPGENIDEIGDRALQAKEQGITMDKFDNFDDYMTALRDFKLDPEVSKKHSKEEKLVAGLAVSTVGVEDKFHAERGSLNGLWLLPMVNPSFFTPERMQGLLEAGRLGGNILAYLDKSLSGTDTRNMEKKLEINLDGSPMDKTQLNTLYGALDNARSNWADVAKQIQNINNA